MQPAEPLDEPAPGIFVSQVYDPKVKADLFSTAITTPAGIYLVDPIPLPPGSLQPLQTQGKIAGIVVTNTNHGRAASGLSASLPAPLYAHESIVSDPDADIAGATGVGDGQLLSEGLTIIAIEGGPAGEIALHHNANGGTLIAGDALINFEPHGFGLLPAKYCLDSKLMRRSLRKVLRYDFERLFFAHGTPILSKARERVEHLIGPGR